ncbi:Type IV secretion system proteins [Marinovum algicola]|uniref:Type IV secretion system protein VirB5 n=1 Tax=Marinovum algicola TaxID=42444 RepID=A0A975WDU8_9RHOB|nr:type IV secretion system protein [Marinovum algicola]SEK03887.1 type IV secretion system protein VirB5 [Marinovum algicola]SLN74728.1 Type IV secretion system proteins [Marinovum algicola]
MTRLLMPAAALAFSLSATAHAQGVPVVDNTAIANAKAEFVKEIAQMVEELEQAKALYASINGLTDMDSIVSALNSPDVRELLGPDAMQIASDFDIDLDDLGDLAGKAQDAADFSALVGANIDADDFYQSELDRIRNQSARDTAVGDRIVTLSDDRLAGLEQLRSKIGTVSTQKEVDALNARIAVEQAMLQNDTNRIQGLAMLQQAQRQVEEQRQTEVAAQRRAKESAAFTSIYGDDNF